MITSIIAQEISNSKYNSELVPWFLEKNREMTDKTSRNRLSAELISRGCFVVPFSEYFSKCYGTRAVTAFSEYYKNGKCILAGSMVIPLQTLSGDLIGYLRNHPKANDKYNYPEKYTFDKSNYFQTTQTNLNKAFEQGFICIVEGVYDEFSVTSLGIPCVGLSGSELGKTRRKILDVIPNKIILSDRDSAGFKLFQECDKYFNGKVINVTLPTRDIDQLLRSEQGAEVFANELAKHYKNGFPYKVIEVKL